MGKITDECGHKPIFEVLEPRLLLDGMTAEQGIELFHTTPAVFIENQGQWDSSVRFVHKGQGANIAHTDSGPVIELFREVVAGDAADPADMLNEGLDAEPAEMERLRFSVGFDGANTVTPVGIGEAKTRFNFFLGEEAQWREDVPSYEIVAYEGLYDGIDLHTWGQRDSLKYEFHVAPGADYSAIRVRYEGIEGLGLTEDGSLAVDLGDEWGQLIDDAPYIYQIVDGAESAVAGRFVLLDDWTYSFEIEGNYNLAGELIIDPDLSWATYLGGSDYDAGQGVTVNASGSAFVAGYTLSTDFAGANNTYKGGTYDAFLAKLTSEGTMVWATYIGGSNDDHGEGIAVGTSGSIFVSGWTSSTDFSGANNAYHGGDRDVFVAKVTSGGTLAWSTYVGGSSYDYGRGITVDASGSAFVTGWTDSINFSGANNAYMGAYDAFVAKLTSGGTPDWTTYLGDSRNDYGEGIAVDASGIAFVTGRTFSWNFSGANNAYKGNGDAFVAKVMGGGTLDWATHLGGNYNDYGEGIALDASGSAFVTGRTNSTDFSGAINTKKGRSDAFLAKVTSGGVLDWATHLGGSDHDAGQGVALDASGSAFVTGYTDSIDFSGANNTYKGGTYDAFLAKLTSEGTLVWATYRGGSGREEALGIAVDTLGSVFVTGWTDSTDFSGTNTPYRGGISDAFVAKFIGAGMGSVTHTDFELLARETAYESWSENTPVGVKDFVVDREFDGLHGFYALGLTSEAYDSILLIRGTDGFLDWWGNVDSRGIGYRQFMGGWCDVRRWLLEQEAAGYRVDIVGHSLGGAVAQWIAAVFTSNEHCIGEVVTFNSPGISDSTNEYRGLLTYAHEFDASYAQSVTHYIVNGDLASMAGEAFIGEGSDDCEYVEASFSDLTWIDFDKHLRPILVDEARGRTRPGDIQLAPPELVATDTINDPDFEYTDPDYRAWQTGMQIALFALNAANPLPPSILYAPAAISHRHTAEAKRIEIGEVIALIADDTVLEFAAVAADRVVLTLKEGRRRMHDLYELTAITLDEGFSLGVDDGDPPALVFDGGLSVSIGDDISIDLPESLGGTYTADHLIDLIAVDTSGRIDRQGMSFSGDVAILGGLLIVDADAMMDWEKSEASFVSDLDILNGFITASSSLTVGPKLDIALAGGAEVSIPEDVEVFGGTYIASGNFALEFSNDSDLSNDFVAGWGSLFGIDLGLQIWLDGDWRIMGAREIEELQEAPEPMQAPEPSAAPETHSYTLEAGVNWALFSMEWENASPGAAVTLETPSGVVLTEADIAEHPDMSIIGDLTTDYRKVVRVDLPAKGIWRPAVIDATGLGQVEFHALVDAATPVVGVTGLSGGGLQAVQIDFEAYDEDSDAEVSLFYDDDNAGFDGVMIAAGIVESDGQDSYIWDIASVVGGDYYVYAMVADGENPPVFDYSGEAISVTDPAGVFDRLLFYNNSALDGNDPLPNASDDAAIAAGKQASMDVGSASSASVTSYARGINGIMVDINGLADPGGITASDFAFRISGSGHPGLWTAGPAPASVTVRSGEGRDGSDRITIIWGDGVIENQWLEVSVLATAGTGLAEEDVFCFANVIGDSDGDLVVNSNDYGTLMGQFGLAGDGFAADFDQNGRVDLDDFAVVRGNFGNHVTGPEIDITDDSGCATDWMVMLPDTEVGQTSVKKTFTLANIGNEMLEITDFDLGGGCPGDFNVTVKDHGGTQVDTGSGGFEIPAGQSCSIDVTFSPSVSELRSAWIFFNTNDPDDSEDRITLIMEGAGRPIPSSPARFSADVDWFWYQDNAGREISCDFSAGAVDNGRCLILPESTVIGRASGEEQAEFVLGPSLGLWDTDLRDGAYSLNIPHASGQPVAIPTAAITVDGSAGDWSGVHIYAEDPDNDSADSLGTDIDHVKLAYSPDGSRLNILYKLTGTAATSAWYRLFLDKDLNGRVDKPGDYQVDAQWCDGVWDVVSQGWLEGEDNWYPIDELGEISVSGQYVELSVSTQVFSLEEPVNVFGRTMQSTPDYRRHDEFTSGYGSTVESCSLNGDSLLASATEWSYVARLQDFENASNMDVLNGAFVATESRGYDAAETRVEAVWFTGFYGGAIYENVLVLLAGVRSESAGGDEYQWEWNPGNGGGLILLGHDPAATVVDLKVYVRDAGQTVDFYYRLNSASIDQTGGAWQFLVSHTLPPHTGAGAMLGLKDMLPSIGVLTDAEFSLYPESSAPVAAPLAPTASAAALLVSSTLSATVVPGIGSRFDDSDVEDDVTASASVRAIDMLIESLFAINDIPATQQISTASSAPTPYREVRTEYDSHPLRNNLASDGEANDLLADILAESALALPL